MKIFFVLPLIISLSLKTVLAQNEVLVKNIVYDVPIINEDDFNADSSMFYYDPCWWFNNLEISKRSFLQNYILNKVEKGIVPVYNEAGKLLSDDDIYNILNRREEKAFESNQPPYDRYDTTITYKFDSKNIHYLRFNESWYYDKKTFNIKKVIMSFAPVFSEHFKDTSGMYEIRKPLFWIRCNDSSAVNGDYITLPDFIKYPCFLRKSYAKEMKSNNFVTISDDSLLWQKYITSIIDSAVKGSIKAYDAWQFDDYYDYSSDSLHPLLPYELYNLTYKEYYTKKIDKPPYELDDSIITKGPSINDYAKLTFGEKWLFNKKTLEIKKFVLTVSPCFAKRERDEKTLIGLRGYFSLIFVKPFRCY